MNTNVLSVASLSPGRDLESYIQTINAFPILSPEEERELAERPPITVPAIVLRGNDSGFGRPSTDPTADRARFTNLVARRIVDGAGHDLAPQRPDAVSSALIELLG